MGYSTTTSQLFLNNVAPNEPSKPEPRNTNKGKPRPCKKNHVSLRGDFRFTTYCKGENFALGTSPVLNELHMDPSYERTLDANEVVQF